MAKIKSTERGLTITLELAEFLGVVAGYVTPCLKAKLPKYAERFDRCESVTVRSENGSVVVQLDDK